MKFYECCDLTKKSISNIYILGRFIEHIITEGKNEKNSAVWNFWILVDARAAIKLLNDNHTF